MADAVACGRKIFVWFRCLDTVTPQWTKIVFHNISCNILQKDNSLLKTYTVLSNSNV